MAKSRLNAFKDIKTTLLFWLRKYLKYKIVTLNNEKADKQKIDEVLKKIEYAKSFDEVDKLIKSIKKEIAIYTYYYPISQFLKWLSNGIIDDLKDIDTELVLEFLTQATSSKSPATKINYKNVLMNFFKYVEENNEDEYFFHIKLSNWQRNLKNIETQKPDYLSEEEIDKFLEALERHIFVEYGKVEVKNENTYLKRLYSLAIKLALFGGLRISEIANLTIEDYYVNKELDVLEIYIQKGKNFKSRIVTIPYETGKFTIKSDLESYLIERENFLKERCKDCKICKKLLLITNKCKKLSSPTLERVLQRIFKQAGILTNKKGMHLLRHTHASYFYKKTQDVLLLKERLGHDNLKTTMRYTHIDLEKIKKSANALR